MIIVHFTANEPDARSVLCSIVNICPKIFCKYPSLLKFNFWIHCLLISVVGQDSMVGIFGKRYKIRETNYKQYILSHILRSDYQYNFQFGMSQVHPRAFCTSLLFL